VTDRCPTCGNQGIDTWHVSRCAYFHDLRAQVGVHAAIRGVNVTAALDLFAHLRYVGDDGTQALKQTKVVLDLGWRPAPSDATSPTAPATEPLAKGEETS
jgi:hypothetical protein